MRANRTWDISKQVCAEQGRGQNTWVATYASDGMVTDVMPCIRAFPERVAFGSLSTELGEVKMCLNPLEEEDVGAIHSEDDDMGGTY